MSDSSRDTSSAKYDAQPRHGGELQPVGGLVQAHPQPEVGPTARRGPAAAACTFGATSSSRPSPVRAAERVVLAEHPAAEVCDHAAELQPGRARRDGAGGLADIAAAARRR